MLRGFLKPLLHRDHARRHKKSKQKASVEGTVGKIATAIIARLRNNEYTSIHKLKTDVAAALEDFNNKPFQKREGSRREVFEANERITRMRQIIVCAELTLTDKF